MKMTRKGRAGKFFRALQKSLARLMIWAQRARKTPTHAPLAKSSVFAFM
jgi:hypothetical protein